LWQGNAFGVKVGVAVTENLLELLDGPQRALGSRRHTGETHRSTLETLREFQHINLKSAVEVQPVGGGAG
jgi:hypothetical protein